MLLSIQPQKIIMMRVYWLYILRQLTDADHIECGLRLYVGPT